MNLTFIAFHQTLSALNFLPWARLRTSKGRMVYTTYIYNISVPIQDVAWKTSQEQWTIETGGEKRSGRSVLAVKRDDDDDDMYKNRLGIR